MDCRNDSDDGRRISAPSVPGTVVTFCEVASDNLTCWPRTESGSFAIVTCPKDFEGILLTPGDAIRFCHENGTWDAKSNYSECSPIYESIENGFHGSVIRIIYYVGFTVSVVVLSFALFLFLHFRCLRCLRNTIHCHLIVTFILRNLLWLKMVPTMPLLTTEERTLAYEFACKFIVSLFNYLLVTNFFWMLVEGLYLHTVIVWALAFHNIHFWHYAIIGWCIPAVLVVTWALVKLHHDNNTCWLPQGNFTHDLILIVPILLVLFVNLLFLMSIVWTLVKKLRASNSSQNCLYRKATKATVILFPLLGLTYILFIWTRGHHLAFKYINAIFQTGQGLFVAIFYCFLNTEVQNSVGKCVRRWRDGRKISFQQRQMSIVTNIEQGSVQWSLYNTQGRPMDGDVHWTQGNPANRCKGPKSKEPSAVTTTVTDTATALLTGHSCFST